MKLFRRVLLVVALISPVFATPASAINYTITYNANETQHQAGVTSGAVPTTSTHASGDVVTVAANSGNLARQGFTFEGWNTAANGTGINFTAGSGTLTITNNLTLYGLFANYILIK